MTIGEPSWNWGPAWNGVRSDLNMIAWLWEEERTLQRTYVESMFFAVTGMDYSVEQFAKDVGFGVAAEVSPDESEQPAQVALDSGGESQSGH